jgi:hypothetical protein
MEEKRQRVLQQLEANGIQSNKLPKHEVESGDGEVIRAYSKWHNFLDTLRRNNNIERLQQMETLLSKIEQWRSNTAVRNRMAPGSVLSEHTLVSIAYAVATMPPGVKIDTETLYTVGVRTNEISSLVSILGEWVDQYQPKTNVDNTTASIRNMELRIIQGHKPWKYAVYKPAKKTGVTTWEVSYNRFANGDSPQAIAISQPNGKQPIQVKTVVGHLLEALEHGREVDLSRLYQFLPPPNEQEWNQLLQAEITSGMDIAADPMTSGKDRSRWTMTDFLAPIVGDDIAYKPHADRTPEERETFGYWCDRLTWYKTLRRCGYEPTFR